MENDFFLTKFSKTTLYIPHQLISVVETGSIVYIFTGGLYQKIYQNNSVRCFDTSHMDCKCFVGIIFEKKWSKVPWK